MLISSKYSELAIPQQESSDNYLLHVTGTPAPSFALYDTENEIFATEPEHFKYLPPNFLQVKNGQWVVDYMIERHNDDSDVVNVYNDWKLPRRLELIRAFTDNLGKVNKQGNLSLIPSSGSHVIFNEQSVKYKVHLSLPEDGTVFSWLVVGSGLTEYHDVRNCINQARYVGIGLSDKGQNHRGLVSRFRNVKQAAQILTNKFWRTVVRECMTNRDKHYSLSQLEGMLNKIDRVELEQLAKQLNFNNINKIKPYLKHNLRDVLNYLVQLGIIQQVHDWRCSYCGSHNKRSLDTLRLKNSCDVCEKEYTCPIDFCWYYSPSAFVVDTLAVRSGLTVLWAISHLIERLWNTGSAYLPEVDLYKSNSDDGEKNEIDILAIIAGKFYACEAKLSVKAFVDSAREIDIFIEEVKLLRPDFAVLAFECYKSDDDSESVEEIKKRLDKVLEVVKLGIPDFVMLESIIAQDIPSFSEFPVELGPWGVATMSYLDKLGK